MSPGNQTTTVRRATDTIANATLQWLRGERGGTPWCHGPPDPETWPLVEDLVRLNEAGLATLSSQPGMHGEVHGVPVEQRAYVDGVADFPLARMVVDVAAGTDLVAFALPVMQDAAVSVAVSRGAAGNHMWGDVERAHDLVEVVSPEVLDWRDTWKVLVVDPEWGRPRALWDMLRSITG
ncbi:MAG: hypothetical protein ACFCVF_00400 [Kineosporiaceae bacterium]